MRIPGFQITSQIIFWLGTLTNVRFCWILGLFRDLNRLIPDELFEHDDLPTVIDIVMKNAVEESEVGDWYIDPGHLLLQFSRR